MDKQKIITLVSQLDTIDWHKQESVWSDLRSLNSLVVPYLLEAYTSTKKWQGRVALIYHSIPFARTSDAAFQLGLLGCNDKASLVRYRACSLLAYSLRKEALPTLNKLLRHTDSKTVEAAAAAIDAIRFCNHHYFIDRNHSGKILWQVD
jgi:hypothetical protein